MPTDYSKTVIYRIPVGDKNYYGHTTQPLHKRKAEHKKDFKREPNRKVYKAMRDAGITANDIELVWVEDYPCKSKNEAEARERYWVETGGTLNAYVPNRSDAERNRWRWANDDKWKGKRLAYHRELVREKRANDEEWWDKRLAYNRARWANDEEWRDKRLAHNREKVECNICGKLVGRGGMARHKKKFCKGKTASNPENLTENNSLCEDTTKTDTMPPRRKNVSPPTSFTLEDAMKFLDGTSFAENTKANWKNNLTNVMAFNLEDEEQTFLPIKELQEKYKDYDLLPLVKDFDLVKNIIENQVISRRDGEPISLNTKKQLYNAIDSILVTSSPIRNAVPKETRAKYTEMVKHYDTESTKMRDKSVAQRGNILHPDLTWPQIQKEFQEFITTKSFTNTGSGKKNLKSAVIAGLYTLHRPRRIEDYAILQLYSKLPSENEMKNKNILLMEKDNMTLYIDKFKTRWRANKRGSDKKELLPRYIKQVDKQLKELFRDYIKKFEIKDMSKLSPQEKRGNKQYYIFNLETDESIPYTSDSFGGFVSKSAFPTVFKKRKGLSVNSFRHAFNTWITQHFNEYTVEQHKSIMIDVGDSPRMPTNLGYQIANVENQGLTKSQIDDVLKGKAKAKEQMEVDAEGEGSVMGGNAPNVRDVEMMDVIEEEGSELVEASAGADVVWSVADITRRLGELEVEKAKLLRMLLA